MGETLDGLKAVQRAVELKPDLDIGLPGLNGIEAARKIRKLVPESKIIFLTQDCKKPLAWAHGATFVKTPSLSIFLSPGGMDDHLGREFGLFDGPA